MSKKTIIISTIIAVVALTILLLLIFNGKQENIKSVNLKISCNGNEISNTYKKGDKFECELADTKYKLTVKSISNDEIKIQANEYGLFPQREDGTISLTDKVKDFKLYKNNNLVLVAQATDVSANIIITWDK